jgi:glycosyltransferase involved in cell wall biosynthesis
MKKISCIIPAYNEEKNIEKILSIVTPLVNGFLFEVIVVDDASGDNTKQIIKKFTNIRLIEHESNKGKSRTVADGILASKGDYIFLLDADLRFLTEKNIFDLIEPIESNKADVTISYRRNAWPLFPFKKIDYLSGERIFPKKYFVESIKAMSLLPSYGLEVFINRIIIRNKMSISVVQWPNVENVFNQHKYGWLDGIVVVIKIWWNILMVASIVEMYSQNINMIKLMVQKNKT